MRGVFVATGLIVVLGGCGGDGKEGPPGAAGAMGVMGAKGDPGSMGAMGAPGAAGPAGAAGPTGPAGPVGDAGPPGKDGTDGGKITGSIGCGGNLEGTSLWFSYTAVQFAAGAVFSSGAIKANDLQVSASAIFAPEQNGWDTAPVQMTLDSAGPVNAGWWRISLNRTTLVVTIDYNDLDVTGGKKTWTMTPDKCVVNKY